MVVFALIALISGVAYGLCDINIGFVSAITSRTDFILYFLMFFVGISVGLHKGILNDLKKYHLKVLIIPFGIVVGSIIGGMICSPITGFTLGESTAVASGLGWYSLSGITMGKLAGAELGSITFLSNLMREIFSFFLIPVIAKYLNYYSCIAPAGATSEDTTLPMMIKYTNEETVMLSVFNGMICSALVPILISFCYNNL